MKAERSIERFARKLRRYWEAGYPIVWLVTYEEQRAIEVLRRLAPSWPIQIWSWSGRQAEDDLDEMLAKAASSESPGLNVLLDVPTRWAEGRMIRALRNFAASGRPGRHVIIVSPSLELPVELEKDVCVLDFPLPDEVDLRAAVRGEAQRKGIGNVDEEHLARCAGGMTWLEAQRAFRMALSVQDPSQSARLVLSEKRQVMRRSAALELVEPEVDLQDVGGLEVLKGWLRTRVVAFGPEARAFGLPEPRGMMVCGVQGCGKSLVAKATASVFGLPLVRLDFAAVFASSSPELAVRQATRMAEAIAPVVLWVDEIEKGLGQGTLESKNARVFGDFLIWMQEKGAPVFVAATANEVEQLPPELVRRGRFDEVFFVDLPSARERADILAIHLRRRGRHAERYPLEELVKPWDYVSGAEIEQVVIAALFRAFAAKRELEAEDIRLAGGELVPLATMYEERVQALRTWATSRARKASTDRRTLELFED